MDSVDCILVFKCLLEYVGIDKEVVLLVYNDRIEIWVVDQYEVLLDEELEDFFDLVEDVLGRVNGKVLEL